MSPSSRTQTFAHLAQDKAERQLQPASGRGRGKGKGRGRGIKSTETPLVHETMADLNGPENHERHAAAPPAPPYVHETLADLNNPDPNSIQPKAPRGKRAKTPATTAPQSDKPKGEAAPKTSRTKKGADLKPSSEDKPARKYRKKDHVASGTSEVKQEPESDKESTTPQPSESDGAKKTKAKKTKAERQCWDRHANHQRAKEARREKAQAGLDKIRSCGISLLESKVSGDFDRMNLNLKMLCVRSLYACMRAHAICFDSIISLFGFKELHGVST